MTWRINFLFIIAVLFLNCKDEKTIQQIPFDEISTEVYSYLIEVNALLKIVDQPHIKILDFRRPEIYSKEHILGAINIWRTDIEDSTYPYKGMMASQSQIESLFSNLGIRNTDTLVIYDDNGLCDSSRLWWILQNYDFTKVKLLHGGIKEWKANNGRVSIKVPAIRKSTFKLSDHPSMKYLITKEEVRRNLSKTIILDTRTENEYSGKRQKKGAAKGGRILNSKLIDWSTAIDFHGDMKLKSIDDLMTIYEEFATKEDTVIVYCHSGVRSAHTTFVLTQILGYKHVKNYDGSWSEWSYFKNFPFEQDSITTIKN